MDAPFCISFCGCEYSQASQEISLKVYMCLLLIVAMVLGMGRMGTLWFIYKDYYPLKLRSPLLTIIMLTLITLQFLMYPSIFVYTYFSHGFDQANSIYKLLWFSLNGSIYFIYLLRAIRLAYSHQVHSKMEKSLVFLFFRKEYLISLLLLLSVIARSVPLLYLQDNTQFLTSIELNNLYLQEYQFQSIFREIFSQTFWTIVLLYSLYLQGSVHKLYSMKSELLWVISIKIGMCIILFSFLLNYQNDSSLYTSLCWQSELPLTTVIESFSLLLMLIISIIIPMVQRKVNHVLLPTGRTYDIVITMRDFLIEPQFMEIFTSFLQSRDHEQGTQDYLSLLNCWKKLMILKYQQEITTENLKDLLEDIDKNEEESKSQLVVNLRNSLQTETIGEMRRESCFYEIKESVNGLELVFLQKLDEVYRMQYMITQSYQHLKRKLKAYNRIKVNMILLNLTMMVQSVNDISTEQTI